MTRQVHLYFDMFYKPSAPNNRASLLLLFPSVRLSGCLWVLLSQFLSFLNHLLNWTDHVEGLLGQSIILTWNEMRTKNAIKLQTELRKLRITSHKKRTTQTYHQGCSWSPWWFPWGAPACPSGQWRPRPLGMAETGNAGSYGHEPQWVYPPQTTHPYPGWQWYPVVICSPTEEESSLVCLKHLQLSC